MLIRDKDKQTLIEIFSTVELPIEVWAYGSRVTGEAHSGSDLDLVIKSQGGKRLPIDIYSDLVEKIRESNIPIVVELFSWESMPKSFHQNIEKAYEVLFSNAQMDGEPLKS